MALRPYNSAFPAVAHGDSFRSAHGDHLSITIALDKESRESSEDRVKALQEKLEKRGGPPEQKNFKL